MRPQWPALELAQQQDLLQAWRFSSSRQRVQDQTAAVSFQTNSPSKEKQTLKTPKKYFWMVCINALSLSWHWPRLCCFPTGSSQAKVQWPHPSLLMFALGSAISICRTGSSSSHSSIPKCRGKSQFPSVCVGFVPFPSQSCNGFAARREVMMETESPCLLSHTLAPVCDPGAKFFHSSVSELGPHKVTAPKCSKMFLSIQ